MTGVLGVDPIPLGLGVAACAAVAAVGVLRARRASPTTRERKRRLAVNARGKTASATVVDYRGEELFYSYTVHGAQYAAAQDVSDVPGRPPAESVWVLGPATVKYDPANPANSILLCEEWSGLRSAAPGEGSQSGHGRETE